MIEKAETTSATLAAVGAEGVAETVDQVRDALQGISTSTSGLNGSLENAAKTLEAAKG
ncbi:hypothetical protein LWF15_28000 [Kineosporia rhizophila]|uniref:hypothetical protein n=1 Tax=Kineosporia rhizophila TaxID=84633 RepID=UPI001E476960|nr:hypothetical protein [Kineosporia rhizophila]MCE0539347.1 hypothetical protein [Kineosporia rhizophila]